MQISDPSLDNYRDELAKQFRFQIFWEQKYRVFQSTVVPLFAAIFWGEHRLKRISTAHERSELAKQSGLSDNFLLFRKPFQRAEIIKIRFYLRFALAIRFIRVPFFSQYCQ